MPVYLTRRDTDHQVQDLEAPTVVDAADRADFDNAHLAWPATAAAATAELAELARDLAGADVTVKWHRDGLDLPNLAAGPGDTAGIRVRATGRAPHALYVITATDLVPHTHAAGALAYLQPLIDAAALGCDGCGADPGEPCLPNCLPDPSTT
ncbi:hypothetical protein [Streptomyces sp. NBC_00154]|uniref:hypothetical protein n=1 Tax=Streptomyces sp. NBC_00154 TaxID=2975670 RepID=UPI00224DA5E4|nr:hypothetical protein [Streptomyces sp. NBC_00154]MCX5318118.1 hypothetical protein [Streptomyces sp. NBC_00154]